MYNSLSAVVTKREIIQGRLAIALMGVITFVLFTALGAYVYIPLRFTPIPITLQTFFVLLSGGLLGKRLGPLSQAAYLVLGAAGFPLFLTGSFGFSYMFGVTGGYLVGFVLAAYVIGRLLKEKDSTAAIIIALTAGELIILSCGGAWLWIGLNFGFKQALYLGVLPFIPGDTIKLIAAILICRKYFSRAKSLFYRY